MSWQLLDEELARWRDGGRVADFWWRDDDATVPTPQLRKLLQLSATSGVPLALAVIPLVASPELFDGLEASVLMHGTDHRNRALAGEKKTEFAAAESEADALQRLSEARQILERHAGKQFVPALAPPWNRFRRSLAARLPQAGLHGLSACGSRDAAEAAPGVAQANAHIDIIDWRGTRGFVGEETALRASLKHLAARRNGEVDATEPTGWLTHHAVHDAAAWSFLERLFERTRARGARWAIPSELFPSRGS